MSKYARQLPDILFVVYGPVATCAYDFDTGAWAITEWRSDMPRPDQTAINALMAAHGIDTERALLDIDGAAETARLQFITNGSGQAMSYQAKAAEATDCLATYSAESPPPSGKYLLLESEIGTTAGDVMGVAAVVDGKRQQYVVLEAQINHTRLAAKAAAAIAPDAGTVDTIVAGLIWPTPS